MTARGIAGHGSVPLETNALAHLGEAVGAIAAWTPPMRINETTAAYFKRLATVSSPEEAARYRDAAEPRSEVSGPADAYLRKNEPSHWSMLRTSLSPTIIGGGYRTNVIPSEGTATIDTRLAPDEDPAKFLELVKQVVNDPQVEVELRRARHAAADAAAKLDSDAFKALEANITKHYKAITLPTMSTGATDMAFLRRKGMQCYGIGPATDTEDGPKGFGAHSDQERILESELFRFVRFNWDAVVDLARAKIRNLAFYPASRKGDVVDDYGPTRVPDPYRWMEDLDSAEVAEWVAAQNAVTQAHLESLPLARSSSAG